MASPCPLRRRRSPTSRRRAAATPQKRLIEHVRTRYRPDDLGASEDDPLALLPLGTIQPLALPGESYKLAFTPGLLTRSSTYGAKASPADAADPAILRRRTGELRRPGPATATGGFPRAASFYSPDATPHRRPGTGPRPPALLPAAPLSRPLRAISTTIALRRATTCCVDRRPRMPLGNNVRGGRTTTASCSPGW